MNKKGQLGLDTVKAVLLAVLILGVIAIASLLALVTIGDSVGRTSTIVGTPVVNESMTFVIAGNTTQFYQRKDITLSNIVMYNGSGVISINSANYTVSGGRITALATSVYGNQTVKVSYSYTTSENTQIGNQTAYYESGVLNFFTSIPTIFILLGVVVLILAIGIIISQVGRFGGGSVESL